MSGMITVILNTPDFKEIVVNYGIDIKEWRRKGLGPLPQNHDFVMDMDSHQIAHEQRRERARFVEFLAQSLAQYITRAIERQDPINGYSRDEYERMHGFGVGSKGPNDRAPVGHQTTSVDVVSKRIPLSGFDKDQEVTEHFLDDSEEGRAGDQGE